MAKTMTKQECRYRRRQGWALHRLASTNVSRETMTSWQSAWRLPAIMALLVMCAPVWALGDKPPVSQPVTAESTATSAQGQVQQQAQQQIATGGHAEAQGGDALAVGVGGEGGSAAANSEASASNEGNELTVQTTYRQVRQAPSVAQGSLMIGQCGAGVNGGGSGTGGAAFLGIAWTPRECHKYLTAANYAGLGMHSFACAILNTTRATKETVREFGIDLPDCDFFEHTVTVEEVRYVTPDELDAAVIRLQESQDRAWRSAQGGK